MTAKLIHLEIDDYADVLTVRCTRNGKPVSEYRVHATCPSGSLSIFKGGPGVCSDEAPVSHEHARSPHVHEQTASPIG
jgi:hypothetical protein